MKRRAECFSALRGLVVFGWVFTLPLAAQTSTNSISSPQAPLRKFKATDADSHNVYINRPGVVTLLLGTNQDSQDAARSAGEAVYLFRGRPDFALVVIVDLRDSIAGWAPSIVLAEMRANLDKESISLKPYYLQNGNTSNPRNDAHVIADFTGTICPELGWPEHSDELRAILFGGDGREIKRWDKLEDMQAMEADVRAAIESFDKVATEKNAAAIKAQGSKIMQLPSPPKPLPPEKPSGQSGSGSH